MDRLTSLTVFTKVVDCGGFSAAARRLTMSTSMVCSHVQALEEHLGARLLNRTTRKINLTEVGKAYYERCIRILADLDEADQAASALQTKPKGTLRLFTNAHMARVIAPVVSQFLKAHPEVSMDVSVGEHMPNMIEEGIDLAIRTTPPRDSSLIVRRLAGWRPVLCASPGYFEHNPKPQRLADLAQHNCLQYAFYPYGNEWRFTGPNSKPVRITVKGSLISASAEILRQAALDGHGLFLAPTFVVGEDLDAGRLVHVLDRYQPGEFSINAIYPHRRYVSAKVRGFIDLLVEQSANARK
ncbi:MAG: LysR family transcriptional regulator [Ensifer alkalisoli]|nr:LysR family transcriptional regulator [Sinorhizobium alkalisoli]